MQRRRFQGKAGEEWLAELPGLLGDAYDPTLVSTGS
jgi:hypothetical protein